MLKYTLIAALVFAVFPITPATAAPKCPGMIWTPADGCKKKKIGPPPVERKNNPTINQTKQKQVR